MNRPEKGRTGAAFLRQTLRRSRAAILAAALFSLIVNLLMLTTSFYSLQVFDRVLTSRSIDTLLYLSLIAVIALLVLWVIDLARSQVMTAVGTWFDERISPRIISAAVAGFAPLAPGSTASQPLRDVTTIRSFLLGPHLLPIMDLPWAPLILLLLFLLHPLLGLIALGGACVLLALALIGDWTTRAALERAGTLSVEGAYDGDSLVRNVDAARAMGIGVAMANRWRTRNASAVAYARHAALRSNITTTLSKLIRQLLQLAMLGCGAWLALEGLITGGALIASSILVGRALAPVESAIAAWRLAIATRQAFRRLAAFLEGQEAQLPEARLHRPAGRLRVEEVFYAYPGQKEPALRGVSFALEPGEMLAVIGPSGSGKTTLARLLVGALRPGAGAVRIDNIDMAAWDPEDRGPRIGFLPQDLELFRGTVEENIARLREPAPALVADAAEAAHAHETIQSLANGYQTMIGEGGHGLSGGQAQMIGLARALYGAPNFVVLDEPGAHFDQQAEAALGATLEELKRRKVTVVVITHRPFVLQYVDKILMLRDGRSALYGPRNEVLQRLQQQAAAARRPSKPPEAAHG
jgi:PrtD family type I secretion system ABC transporter